MSGLQSINNLISGKIKKEKQIYKFKKLNNMPLYDDFTQVRAFSGNVFKNEINERRSLTINRIKPNIKWLSKKNGSSKIDSIYYQDFSSDDIELDFLGSLYEKRDSVDNKGFRYEIKKYPSTSDWELFSEPIMKICTWDNVWKYKNKKLYNENLRKFFNSLLNDGTLEYIKEKMISGIDYIILMDRVVSISDVEFKWVYAQSFWREYDRIQLKYRVKR